MRQSSEGGKLASRDDRAEARLEALAGLGWCRFDHDPELAAWVDAVLPAARDAVADPANARWLRCEGTWFAGVNVLDNDADGGVGDGGPLRGEVVDFIRGAMGLGGLAWDCGQISVCHPGYPQPMPSESRSAFRYRRDHDASHVDGLLPEGRDRRRHLREHHAFILGLPLVKSDQGASPFVVWEGSHELVRAAFTRRFEGLSPQAWGDEDITEAYHAARRRVFDECPRVEIQAQPGEAYLAHRLVVHGVAPWSSGAGAGKDGRMLCYFRPEMGDPRAWLLEP